jgi:hypothetical protein
MIAVRVRSNYKEEQEWQQWKVHVSYIAVPTYVEVHRVCSDNNVTKLKLLFHEVQWPGINVAVFPELYKLLRLGFLLSFVLCTKKSHKHRNCSFGKVYVPNSAVLISAKTYY